MKSVENKRWILMTAIILMLCVSSLCERPIRTEAASKISRQKNGLQKKEGIITFTKMEKSKKDGSASEEQNVFLENQTAGW